jgi:urea transport system ATP-binding protein
MNAADLFNGKAVRQGWQKVFGAGTGSDRPMPGDASHGTILYVEDISVSFDGFRALNNLTLYIDVGELRCIIGPNGAGKTTMMDVITGKTRPDSGSAWFGTTTDLLTLTEPEIAEAGIGRKFQKPTVFEQHSVLQNLALAAAGNSASGTRCSNHSLRRSARASMKCSSRSA